MPEEMMTSQQPASKGSKTNMLIVVVVVLLLIGAAVAYSQTRMSSTTQTTTSTSEMESNTPTMSPPTDEDAMVQDQGMALEGSETGEMMEAAEVRTIQVEAGAFYYKPDSITVKKGEKVKIVMTSKDMMHDFTIDELGVKLPITKSGETNTVEFTATQVGTFEYYCSVGQHRANGQVGTIIVQP